MKQRLRTLIFGCYDIQNNNVRRESNYAVNAGQIDAKCKNV
jgi:hypothetical protein